MATINIALGANIATAVAGGVAGNTYQFAPGIYYGQQWNPKLADVYLGDPSGNTVLSGAWRLPSWTNSSGNLWKATQGISDVTGLGTLTNLPNNNTSAIFTASFSTTGGSAGGPSLTLTGAPSSGSMTVYSTLWNAAGTIPAGTGVGNLVSGTPNTTGAVYDVLYTSFTLAAGTVYATYSAGQGGGSNPLANLSEDLWVNGVLYTRLLAPGPATANSWWWNPTDHSVNAYFTSNPQATSFTGVLSINSAGLPIVTASVVTGTIAAGQALWNSTGTVWNGQVIIGQLTGTTGGAGTYQVSLPQTLGSVAMNSGTLVEYACVPYQSYDNGTDHNVTWNSIITEKYCSRAYIGVQTGQGWIINNSTWRYNHAVGFEAYGLACTINNSNFNNNGQNGITGSSIAGGLIQNCQLNNNGYAGFNPDDNSAGIKLTGATGVKFIGNTVSGNSVRGVWFDVDSSGIIISNNKVFNNTGPGIHYEISHGPNTIISNNLVSGSAGGPGIYIANSSGVTVYGNVVTVGGSNSGINAGINIINAVRGAGSYGPYEARNNTITNNVIIHLTDTAYDGIFVYQAIAGTPGNVFNYNVYVTSTATGTTWEFDSYAAATQTYTWAALQAAAVFEVNGQNLVGTPTTTYSGIMSLLRDGQGAGGIAAVDFRDLLLTLLTSPTGVQWPF